MKSHEIVENPQNVIYSKEIQQTEKDFFNKYLNNLDKVVVIDSISNETLYIDEKYYKIFSIDNKIIKYTHTFMPFNSGIQSLIVNKNGSKFKASHVFFKHLLPKYGIVYSDKAHSESGAKLWEKLIRISLKNNIIAGVSDLSGKILYEFDNFPQENLNDIWGDDNSYLSKLVFIKKR